MYKLINKITNQETLCDKVTIDGFDYYVSKITYVNKGELFYNIFEKYIQESKNTQQAYWINKVIATNNPNITNLSKIIDVIEEFYKNAYKKHSVEDDKLSLNEQIQRNGGFIVGYKEGYKESQKTHSNSNKDMLDFYFWLRKEDWRDYFDIKIDLWVNNFGLQKNTKELIEMWKEQSTKTVYYE